MPKIRELNSLLLETGSPVSHQGVVNFSMKSLSIKSEHKETESFKKYHEVQKFQKQKQNKTKQTG